MCRPDGTAVLEAVCDSMRHDGIRPLTMYHRTPHGKRAARSCTDFDELSATCELFVRPMSTSLGQNAECWTGSRTKATNVAHDQRHGFPPSVAEHEAQIIQI